MKAGSRAISMEKQAKVGLSSFVKTYAGSRFVKSSLVQRRFLLRLPHEFKCLDAADVGVWTALEGRGAERTAEGNHPLALLDSGEPFSAGDFFVADSALNAGTIKVTGIEVRHRLPFSKVSVQSALRISTSASATVENCGINDQLHDSGRKRLGS
jgi:hypothetical protein